MNVPEYKKGDCRFCYDVQLQKFIIRTTPQNLKDKGIYHKLKVALVVHTYLKGYGCKGRYTLRPLDLNFCPECGKPLKKHRNIASSKTD